MFETETLPFRFRRSHCSHQLPLRLFTVILVCVEYHYKLGFNFVGCRQIAGPRRTLALRRIAMRRETKRNVPHAIVRLLQLLQKLSSTINRQAGCGRHMWVTIRIYGIRGFNKHPLFQARPILMLRVQPRQMLHLI
jgi:hypothetical protein